MADATPIKLWTPSAYVDEVAPAARISPEAWLSTGGLPGRIVIDECDVDGIAYPEQEIAVGEVVEFEWRIDYPTARATIYPDGTWMALTPIPPAANCFWLRGDSETMAHSMEEFAEFQADAIFDLSVVDKDPNEAAEPETMDVDVCQWSDETVRLRLTLTDGRLSFVPVEEGGAA